MTNREVIFSVINKDNDRKDIYNILTRTGFHITYAREVDENNIYLFAKPNIPLRETLVLNSRQELLVWFVDYSDLRISSLRGIEKFVESEERPSEEFVIVICSAFDTQENIQAMTQSSQITFTGFSLSEIRSIRKDQEQNRNAFLFALQRQLFRRDPYWMTPAIKNSVHFYGRRDLVTEIARLLTNTGANVGLFGLRKMGKTSFLFRLIDELRNRSNLLICHLDLQRIDAINPTAVYFLWALGERIYDMLPTRYSQQMMLFGKKRVFAEVENPSTIYEYFNHDIETILKNTTYKLIITIDELELMAPITPKSEWQATDFIRIWRLLRGLSQEFGERISFFVTGTNPKIIETNQIDHRDNPIYNFFDVRYLPPLKATESQELLQKYGKRIGLEWSSQISNIVHHKVGGHPFLLRAYASEVYKIYNTNDFTNEFYHVSEDDINNTSDSFYRRSSPHFSQMLDVLNDYYEDEYMLLEILAKGNVAEFREYRDIFPNEINHLDGYGLVNLHGNDSSLSISALQAWLQNRAASKKIRVSDTQPISPGESFLTYTIISQVGHRGGFSKVYKAQNTDGNFVAIKILNDASLPTLQREIAVLEDISHPNIVELIDYGKSDTGFIYIIMEYLSGKSLRNRCDRLNKLSDIETVEYTSKILSALAKIHPKEHMIKSLRIKKDLTLEEYRELGLARHGYIHRDIKPENIILEPQRGPVLIDFNISVLEIGRAHV